MNTRYIFVIQLKNFALPVLFRFTIKWFKIPNFVTKASRLVLGLWVADAYNDINGFSSFCFDRMFHRSKWNTIHIGHWDIIETTDREVIWYLYLNSYNASRIPKCNHIIVSNEGSRIRSLFENLFCQIVSGRIFQHIWRQQIILSGWEGTNTDAVISKAVFFEGCNKCIVTFWSGTFNITDRCWYVSDLAVSKGDQMFCDESGRLLELLTWIESKSDLVTFYTPILTIGICFDISLTSGRKEVGYR